MKTKLLIIFIITFIISIGTNFLLYAINSDMRTEFYSDYPFGYQENTGSTIFGKEQENDFFTSNLFQDDELCSFSDSPMRSSPSDDDDEFIKYVPVGEGLGILILMLLIYTALKVRKKMTR